jgi:preprotein translocase subunit YajC
LGQLIVLVALLALLWLLLIRPARRRQVAQQELLSGIQVDDEILTAGGLYGYVREINDDELIVEVAPDVQLRMARRAVAAVIPQEEEDVEGEIVDDSSVDDSGDPPQDDAQEPQEGSQSANPNDAYRG